ncbi:RDD family protein [Zhihengliuella salsuginis]|uniref:FHA domain-containing protein n=1 Tax=Zhihengliuella salsuginis TaxID=578222 RepID=A0ABQ3GI20_9MICC|nr:RDD family protein [Zhihengliuella salsuginis]GHD08044.1 hypothetical protein GCM10008096_19470 [Zhihengliuella salsuginis]
MAKAMNLVNASAGKRLAGWLLDMVPLAILGAIFGSVMGPRLVQAATAPEILSQIAGTSVLFSVIALAYGVFLWWWEATQGKTIGNVVLSLRTADEDGFAPGWGRVIVRRLLVGVAGIVPVVGPVLMVVSNLWDANHQRQGWHDKVARTLVMDVGAGRDPLTTGGLFGPEAFAPTHVPSMPAAQAAEHGTDAAFTGVINSVPGQPGAPQPAAPAPVDPPQPVAESQPVAAPQAAPEPAPAVPAPEEPVAEPRATEPAAAQSPLPAGPEAHPDDELGHTQFREVAATRARLVFDDGQTHVLDESLLIGRNPSAVDGETVDDLLSLADIGRSMSKTHLLVQASTSGIWVTDRNSTNGSSVTDAAGNSRDLVPGQPVQASMGETVYMGDRYFKVERA